MNSYSLDISRVSLLCELLHVFSSRLQVQMILNKKNNYIVFLRCEFCEFFKLMACENYLVHCEHL